MGGGREGASQTRTVGEQTLLHPLYEALSAMHCGNADRALEVLDRAEGDARCRWPWRRWRACHLLAESYERTHRICRAVNAGSSDAPRDCDTLRIGLSALRG